jgi:uncharacterized protein YfdQ (DUF2303 family)
MQRTKLAAETISTSAATSIYMDNSKLIDINEIERLSVAASVPKIPTDRRQYMLKPDGYEIHEIPALHELPLPDFIKQKLKLVTLESFIRYLKGFGRSTTEIFGSVTDWGCQFFGVIDYHADGEEGKANRLAHVAEYAPKYSSEFAAWHTISGKAMTQDQLLDHLRRWGYTVTNFSDADLIELVSGLEFTTSGTFSSKVERTTGGRKLTYNEDVTANAPGSSATPRTMTVPDKLEIKSAIFEDGDEFPYKADILYRVGGGRLTITIELQRVHQVVREAINAIITKIKTETKYEPFIGSANITA